MSWFARKKKNRRREREHVLDVKLRIRPLKALRLRLAAKAIATSFAILFGVILAWRGGQWAIDEFLFSNQVFMVEPIDVHTDGVLPAEQLRKCKQGIRPGDNLLALDYGPGET